MMNNEKLVLVHKVLSLAKAITEAGDDSIPLVCSANVGKTKNPPPKQAN